MKTSLEALEAVSAKTREAGAAAEARNHAEWSRLWAERDALYEEYLQISDLERVTYEVRMGRASYYPQRAETV